jgi:hypothetical protein
MFRFDFQKQNVATKITIYILNKHELKSKFQYIQPTKLTNSDVIHHLPKMTYDMVFGKLLIVFQNVF